MNTQKDELGRFAKKKVCVNGHILAETAVYYPAHPDTRCCSECIKIRNGRRNYKSEQLRLKRKEWNQKHRDIVSEMGKRYRKKNKEKVKMHKKEDFQKNYKEVIKWKWIKRDYGITREEYNKIFTSQGEICNICGTNNFGKKGPVIDHSHTTGKVRGILCNKCNNGLGLFRDNVEFLNRAVEYLKNNT